jgi:glycosyltransferase involved in cell wall biosynthesis
MRILHVLGKLDRGGVETWLVQLLRQIDRQKYQMDFMVHTADPGAFDEEVLSLGAQIIPCLKPSNPLQYAYNFRRILREYGPYDIVHSHVHHYSGYVLTLAAIAGVPIRIAHSHSDTRQSESSVGPIRKAYRGVMQCLVRSCASGGLAVSTEAGDDLFPPRWQATPRWDLQHLGLDLSRFELAVDRDAIRRELGIPKQAIVIGHVGRFTEEKNHMFLVEIAREVIRLEPRAFFLLVGDGPLRPSIEGMVTSYSLQNRFAFTGVRSDVPTLMMGAMDAFIFPSLREGLPVTMLEAQTAGLKCVISDVISLEADVIPSLIVRESVKSSPAQWAAQLLRQSSIPSRMPLNVATQQLDGRSITESTNQLTSFYATFCRS